MKYIYPAIFAREGDNYIVSVPDLPGCHTFGHSLADAIDMARDAIEMWLVDAEDNVDVIPDLSPLDQVVPPEGGFVNLIDADTDEYRRENDNRAVKKTLTLPSWLNSKAERAGINFSQTLQEALKQRLDLD
ncbi:type II toxin-antitoxin system HicB family antitoxin [Gehongia tenuis]|uniref:Type II toxin-antitoxin system HicB family antitoxin n=1 Tax=Gehongia tenuis TaxID=2763655 RepID=A0A926D7I2_9FIRM|nr:type II toxin-antitoxin system HicB family antitoxin [Gehongia tenuis]MBC8531795.1 type II toxin-antitoxin system HicB family antitoxin [Gehongia tenuis]